MLFPSLRVITRCCRPGKICHHAGHGYAAAQGNGETADCDDGASVESCVVQPEKKPGDGRVWNPAAPGCLGDPEDGPFSLYLRLQDNPLGIDPYTHVSSDVYQDLFGEGSFIGKGIYDVDIFERAVLPVFQDNRILSHDLLEGCYARSGLLSDVTFYEENPAQYRADVKRHHRWIRGDWQVGAWMLPFVTNGKGHLTKNKLSGLSRWKIFDNLRRSLLPLSLLLLLFLGWYLSPLPWLGTLVVTVLLTLPLLTAAVFR